ETETEASIACNAHIACTRSARMFKLFRKSQPQHRPPRSRKHSPIVVFRLGSSRRRFLVLEQRGSYSGRQVTYFRVFDPVRVAERTRRVQAFIDLDSHPELVLGSGHREQNGAIVLTPQDKTALGWIGSGACESVRPCRRSTARVPQ